MLLIDFLTATVAALRQSLNQALADNRELRLEVDEERSARRRAAQWCADALERCDRAFDSLGAAQRDNGRAWNAFAARGAELETAQRERDDALAERDDARRERDDALAERGERYASTLSLALRATDCARALLTSGVSNAELDRNALGE